MSVSFPKDLKKNLKQQNASHSSKDIKTNISDSNHSSHNENSISIESILGKRNSREDISEKYNHN